MATFNINQFRTDLQTAIKENKREMSLTLIAALLMPCDDVKALFTENGIDTKKITTGLQFELKQLDERRKRAEKDEEEEKETFNSESFEEKMHQQRMDKWEKKSEDEALYSLIAAVELRAKIEGREPTGTDMLKEAVIMQDAADKTPFEEGAGVETFRILGVNFCTLFPDLREKQLKSKKTENDAFGERVATAVDAALRRVADHPALRGLMAPSDHQSSSHAARVAGNNGPGRQA